MPEYKIAVIPGDGIGKEVVPEGIRVLNAVSAKFGIRFQWNHFPWSCDYYTQHGRMMPENGWKPSGTTTPSFSEPSAFLRCRTTFHCGDC